ncbi:oligosaccharide flippase family protein [Phyllobacterium sp. LjRoot231]|uniref:oligosaccharide flippase family protein n=1 Tax=Phyllobacterium sp. LjRoot231 TaxID=3342289 RepID=UPI003F5029B7
MRQPSLKRCTMIVEKRLASGSCRVWRHEREKVSRDDVRTAFTLIFGSSILIACLLSLLAPWVSTFYGRLALCHGSSTLSRPTGG